MQRAAPLQIVSEYKHCLLDLKVYVTICAMGCDGRRCWQLQCC